LMRAYNARFQNEGDLLGSLLGIQVRTKSLCVNASYTAAREREQGVSKALSTSL
jgi:hypothetical protein